MMTLVEDTSPGVHDTVIAAATVPLCPTRRRARPSVVLHQLRRSARPSCRSSVKSPVPAPLNLFMNIPWDMDGNITFEPTVSAAGDSVLFRADVDVIVDRLGVPDGHRADQRPRRRQAGRRRPRGLLARAKPASAKSTSAVATVPAVRPGAVWYVQ